MDEPFGALDPINRDRLQDEYARIHRTLDLTTVMVTHDITESLLLADRIAVMDAGRIVRLGTPRELLDDPGGPDVAAAPGDAPSPRRAARRPVRGPAGAAMNEETSRGSSRCCRATCRAT